MKIQTLFNPLAALILAVGHGTSLSHNIISWHFSGRRLVLLCLPEEPVQPSQPLEDPATTIANAYRPHILPATGDDSKTKPSLCNLSLSKLVTLPHTLLDTFDRVGSFDDWEPDTMNKRKAKGSGPRHPTKG